MRPPPYLRYRDSGAEWLGEIPDHWTVKRLKRSAVRSDVKVESEDADQMPYVGLEHVSSWTGTLMPLDEQQMPESLSNAFTGGDVLFGKLRPYLAKAFCADFDGLCSTEFLVLKPFGYQRRYLLYALLTNGFVSLVDSSTFGARMPRASWRFVSDSLLPVPPLKEQQAIVQFLDRETGKIDQLADRKRLLIERLEEYRQALITHTVTKGLPPEAARAADLAPRPRLKPSGVEWLGEIPEHWEVTRLKHVASYRTSSVDKKTEEAESPVRLCNYTDVYYRDRIRASDGDFMEATASPKEITRFKLNSGDVLITKDSEDWRDIAVPALIDETAEDFVCGYHLGIIRPTRLADPEFIFRAMQSSGVNQQLQTSATGVTRYGLPNPAVGGMLIPLPPLEEQQAIAAFLDERLERIDTLTSRVETAIERLAEYRAALITAAVTGKIDVRGGVPAEPERVGA